MIHIDKLRTYPNTPWGHKQWAHLWSDEGVDELHAFAVRLGLKRSWFQDRPGFPHYDVTPGKHSKALAMGAQLTDLGAWMLAKKKLAMSLEVMNSRLEAGSLSLPLRPIDSGARR